MPDVVSIDRMGVGKKSSGRHWTKGEVSSRKAAAAELEGVPLTGEPPVWLDAEARKVWRKTLKEIASYGVLKDVDEEVFAIYCDAVARYKETTLAVREHGYTAMTQSGETVSPYVRAAQSYAKTVMQYGEKLGISATARARLAVKKAKGGVDPNADLFE